LTALLKHTHAFLREVELTHDEWRFAMEYLTAVGKISDEKRKEFILLSDVLGVSMLVVMINGRTPQGATPHTVLGPFHIGGSPDLALGGDLGAGLPGTPIYVSGTVRDLDGQPIAGAKLDLWQADREGVYEAQIPDSGARLRGIQYADADGCYRFWSIAPKGYSIPMDGPVGDLVKKTDICHFRPAHIHFLVSAPGYRSVITHLFEEGAQYVDNDAVFGVKQELVVPFRRHAVGEAPDGRLIKMPFLTVNYDFVLTSVSTDCGSIPMESPRFNVGTTENS
jgi:hydroxyquinol 1,2-dioxygenase